MVSEWRAVGVGGGGWEVGVGRFQWRWKRMMCDIYEFTSFSTAKRTQLDLLTTLSNLRCFELWSFSLVRLLGIIYDLLRNPRKLYDRWTGMRKSQVLKGRKSAMLKVLIYTKPGVDFHEFLVFQKLDRKTATLNITF